MGHFIIYTIKEVKLQRNKQIKIPFTYDTQYSTIHRQLTTTATAFTKWSANRKNDQYHTKNTFMPSETAVEILGI
jgi:hypothetical protein